MTNEEYEKTVLKWRTEVDTNLRRENGWLALAGLFWLRKGGNSVGSDPECDIVLPKRAPRRLGNFEFDGNNVRLTVEADAPVEVNGVETRSALLDADQEDMPSFITMEELRMVVVRRSKGVGIRLWDNLRTERRTFPTRQWYPVKEEFRIPALFTHYARPKIVQMPDILGAIVDEKMDGYLIFKYGGQNYKLVATEEGDRRLFIQFKDLTNGNPTYPAGRYHYTEPHRNGKVFLDFNRAYSPPCAFTDFATCSFAPKENYLNLAIDAGEIFPGHNHH